MIIPAFMLDSPNRELLEKLIDFQFYECETVVC